MLSFIIFSQKDAFVLSQNMTDTIVLSLSLDFQPRLGPKPFTSASGDVSFDKVFSVPSAPNAAGGAGDILEATGEQEKLSADAPAIEKASSAENGGGSNENHSQHDDDEEIVLREKHTAETPEGKKVAKKCVN